MVTKKYNDKIAKIEALIKVWKRRYLTLLGKITVVKSILLPILNHLFMSLPNPEPSTTKYLNNLLYSFIWNGLSKIKQSILDLEYSRGGLKMININAFMAALKVTWIRRLILNDGKWADIIDIPLKKMDFGGSYILELMKTISNPFWIDVLKALYTSTTAYKSEILILFSKHQSFLTIKYSLEENHFINKLGIIIELN